MKQHEVDTLAGLLERSEQTKSLFGGSVESRVFKLRDVNKDDLDKVAALVSSHLLAQSKSKLVFALLDEVRSSGVNLAIPDTKLHVHQGLASLDAMLVYPLLRIVNLF